MRIILKWTGIVVGGLVGLAAVALAAVYIASNARINTTYEIQAAVVQIPTDAEAIAAGEHLAVTRGCTDCHSENLGGGAFVDDPMLGTLYASNLTSGAGGVGAYTDADWVRAIRHGIGPDGQSLIWMPSQEFYFLSDEDLGSLIAYLKTVPAVDNELPEHTLRPMGRALFLAGQLPLLPAEIVEHEAPRPNAPQPGVTAEYGAYLAVGCSGCHGPDYSGGPIPGGAPDWPPAANLTPGGDLVDWSEADFIAAFRTGIKPNGQPFDENMPYEAIGQMTDDELKAVFLFLRSLPATETGNR